MAALMDMLTSNKTLYRSRSTRLALAFKSSVIIRSPRKAQFKGVRSSWLTGAGAGAGEGLGCLEVRQKPRPGGPTVPEVAQHVALGRGGDRRGVI